MATQLRDGATGPAAKHDAYIATQLSKAEGRIRFLDVVTALAGFAAGTLAYAIVLIVLDRQFVLSAASRQMAFLLFLAAAGAYLWYTVVRPLTWRVNPRYAARMLEKTVPGGKNHVLNWIDLRDENLPGVIRTVLGSRAARDLTKTDVDQAISGRRSVAVSGLAFLLLVAFAALFVWIGPGPFRSLLGRAFSPFSVNRIATRTQVAIVRPEGGDAVATIGQPVTIVARVDGRIPDAQAKDAPRLLYRPDATEPYRQRFLQSDDTGREWSATVAPLDVGNGFFYKVAAGDAETPEYRVQVRATPLIADFLANYHYRPYTGKAARSRISRKLDDLRGTQVQILARTNRRIRDGRLDFEGADGVGELIRAEVRPDDPQALRFRLTLDRPGKYRIRFTSDAGEAYLDPVSHEVAVQPDLPPTVRLTEPGVEVKVPANGHVELKGEASDDFGVASIAVHLQVVGGKRLRPQPYLADKLGKPGFGTPRHLEYRDVLDLPALVDEAGQPAGLRAGMVVEYWLEARDGCDYPSANVAVSAPRHRLLIDEPAANADQKKQADAAREKQKQHEQQQGEQLKKDQAERDEQKKKDEAQEKADAKQREQERGKAGQEQKKDDGGKGKSEEKKDEKGGEKNKPEQQGGGERNQGEQGKDDDTRRQADKLKEAVDRREQQKGQGEGKDGGEKKPGESKDNGEKKPGEGKDAPGEKNATPSEKPGNKDGEKAGEKKDGNDPSGKQGEGEGKDEGKPSSESKQGDGKESGKPKDEKGGKPGEQKSAGQDPARQGEQKGASKGGEGKNAGETKPGGEAKSADRKDQGQVKEGRGAEKPDGEGRPAEKKDGAQSSAAKSEGKQGEKTGEKKGEAKPKPADPSTAKPGECKDCKNGTNSGGDGSARPGEGKGSGPGKPAPENARPSDVRERANDLRNGTPDQKQEAARDLKAIRDRANDPQARQDAGKALEQAGKDDGTGQPGQARTPPEGQPQQPGEAKGGQPIEPKGKPTTEAKPGQGEQPGAGKEPGKPKPGESNKEGQQSPGQAKDGKKPAESAQPGQGADTARTPSPGRSDDSDRALKPVHEKPVGHRASMLQLEEFRKKVDPNVLRDAKMSREQYEQFLRDYAELAKRRQAMPEDTDIVPPAGQGRVSLPSVGGRTIKAVPGGPTDDLRSEGRPKPPPEYRDAHSDFLRRLLVPGR